MLTRQRACRHRSTVHKFVIGFTASSPALKITWSSEAMQQCSSVCVRTYYQWVPNIDDNIFTYHSTQNVRQISPWSWPAKTWASYPSVTPCVGTKPAEEGTRVVPREDMWISLCMERDCSQVCPLKFRYKLSSSKCVFDYNFPCGSWNMKLFIP